MATLFRSIFFWMIFGLFLSIYSPPVSALDLDIDLGLGPTLLSQEEFKDLSEEMGLALSYLPLSPAESLGILGIDIGVEVTAANIREDHSYWTKVTEDPLAKSSFQNCIFKGLPSDLILERFIQKFLNRTFQW